MSAVTAEEREAIVEALRRGESIHSVAKECGRSKATVHGIASDEGIQAERSGTKKSTEAHKTFAKARRQEVSDLLFEKLCQMAAACEKEHGLRELATVFGILTDKRRLEEGEATERWELLGENDPRLERLRDLLADRRGEGAATSRSEA